MISGVIVQLCFDLVQKLITSRRSGETKWGENIFAGLLVCADCGYRMRRNKAHRALSEDLLLNMGYCCTRYATFGKEQCTQHWTEARDLYDTVLADIRFHARQAVKNGEAFARQIMECKNSRRKVDSIEQSRELRKSRTRLAELDRLFQKLYEDRASGSISERNYLVLAGKYEAEQQELEKRICDEEQALKDSQQTASDVRAWVSAIQQYINTMELNAPMLHELIEKITVNERKLENGEQIQALTIYYRFVGNIS